MRETMRNRRLTLGALLLLLAALGCVTFPQPAVVVTVIALPPACAGRPVVVTVVATPTSLPIGEGVAATAMPAPTRETAAPQATKEAAPFQIHVDAVAVLTETVVVTVTVTSGGPQSLLFEPPELHSLRATGASLEAAHFALLDLVTQGQAVACLEFPRPPAAAPWTLAFNPGHTPDDFVAPRVEAEIWP